MKSTSRYLRETRISTIALPRMAKYASCLLLPVLFWLYHYGSQRTGMGIISSQKSPITHTIACKGPTDFAVISLNEQGQFAFSVLGVSPQIQAAVINAVAYQHGIILNTEQLIELESLPFLSVDINELPRLLSLPYNRRSHLVELARFKPVSEDQLVACAVTTRRFNRELYKRPITISLRIDTEANSGKVLRAIDRLQSQGFERMSYQNQFF
jgi:hypothetical protein